MENRKLPRVPLIRAILVIASFTILTLLVMWLKPGEYSRVFIFFAAIGAVYYFYYYRRRCPQCGNRLVLRRNRIGDTQRFRLFMDCSHCQIAWDTGNIDTDTTGV